MQHPESDGILDGCGFKESNPVLGLDDLAGHPKLGGRKYGCVSPQPMNSMNSSAEASQPKQNKHPPNADDPTLDPGRDRPWKDWRLKQSKRWKRITNLRIKVWTLARLDEVNYTDKPAYHLWASDVDSQNNDGLMRIALPRNGKLEIKLPFLSSETDRIDKGKVIGAKKGKTKGKAA